jgi:hypothetical protein
LALGPGQKRPQPADKDQQQRAGHAKQDRLGHERAFVVDIEGELHAPDLLLGIDQVGGEVLADHQRHHEQHPGYRGYAVSP